MRRLSAFALATIVSAFYSVGPVTAGELIIDNLPTMAVTIDGDGRTWGFAPTVDMFAPISGGGGYQMTSSPTFQILGGRAEITIETLAFDPDPFVMNNILVTNTTNSTQIFSAFVGLPTTFGAPNLISGVALLGVIDGGNDGATLATVSPTSLYQAQIDGTTVATLFDHSYSLTAPPGGVNSDSASFGPDVNNVPVTSNIGIQLRFSLSPGDTASILSRFDVVAIPAPGALGLLGVAALMIKRRRRA